MKNICVKIIPGAPEEVRKVFHDTLSLQISLLATDKRFSFSFDDNQDIHYDYHLFIKDSIILRSGALAGFMDCADHLPAIYPLVGSVAGPDGKWCGGGLDSRLRPVIPEDIIPIACDTFSSCILLLPSAVTERMGFVDKLPSSYFSKLPDDVNYGLFLRDSGFVCVVAPSFMADSQECSNSLLRQSFPKAVFGRIRSKMSALIAKYI